MEGAHIHQNHTYGDPCICHMSGLVGNHSAPSGLELHEIQVATPEGDYVSSLKKMLLD